MKSWQNLQQLDVEAEWKLKESYDVGAEIERPKHADLEFRCLGPCTRMQRPIDGQILQYHMRDICCKQQSSCRWSGALAPEDSSHKHSSQWQQTDLPNGDALWSFDTQAMPRRK